MKKVLIISTIGIGYEGMSSVLYNFLSNMSRNEISVDIAVYKDINPKVLLDFEKIAGIRYVHDRKNDFIKYIKDLKRIFPEYSVVHINGNSSTMLVEYYMAKKSGVDRIILHNHSASTEHPLFNKITRPLIRNVKAEKLACSELSGEWLFGKENYKVLNNAIDVKRFAYNNIYRKQLRESLNVKNAFFVGHIGHFSTVKNHEFIIEVFSEFVKMRQDAVLGLVSDGPTLEKIKIMVDNKKLKDKVLFLGRQQNPEYYYSAFDAFIFPSLNEGFGLVAIEAQATGLPVLASTGVPRATRCSNIISYKELDAGAKEWAKELVNISKMNINRSDQGWKKNIVEHGFDIRQQANKLLNIYLNCE